MNQTIGANAPKGIMDILNSSKALMVQQGQTTLSQIMVGLGLAMATSHGGLAKVMKARLLDFFMGKDTKVKQMHQCFYKGGLFEDLMFHLKQGANSFHTDFPQGECVRLVDDSKTKDIQLV